MILHIREFHTRNAASQTDVVSNKRCVECDSYFTSTAKFAAHFAEFHTRQMETQTDPVRVYLKHQRTSTPPPLGEMLGVLHHLDAGCLPHVIDHIGISELDLCVHRHQ